MLLGIYVICLLFFTGLLFGLIGVVSGLKGPLKRKDKKVGINCCNECNKEWKWYELIPIVSFFLSRGECPYCHKELTLWYPFLELLSAILFAFSYMIYGFSYEMLIMILLTILSVIIFVSDFNYFVIMDKPLVIFSILILVLKFIFFGFDTLLLSFVSGAIMFLFLYIIKVLGGFMFKEESLGGGDIKLSALFGFTLGIRLSIIALIIGSFLAFPYAFYLSISNKGKNIPFGPFLMLGLYITYIFMSYINAFLAIIF